jgi:cyclic beta-1,2-glucan synthetase
LMNWYDTHTLEAKAPFFISSVDSGNLVASLWTLQQGCLDRLSRPLLSKALANGFIDHLRVLANFRAIPKRVVSDCEENFRKDDWLTAFLNFSEESLGENEKNDATAKSSPDLAWFQKQTKSRIQSVRALVETYMPWRLPEFTDLREKVLAKAAQVQDTLPLRQLPDLISEIEIRLEEALPSAQNGSRSSSMRLKLLLEEARTHATTLIDSLHQASLQAHALAQAMDFKFLVEKQRLLMSVGFDAQTEEPSLITTICWPPNLEPPSSLPSRKKTYLRITGSGWTVHLPSPGDVRCCSRGQARCSST